SDTTYISYSSLISDEDSSPESIQIKILKNTANHFIDIDSVNCRLGLRPDSNYTEPSYLHLSINDGYNTIEDSVLVKINPVNDSPIIELPFDSIMIEEDHTLTLELKNLVYDVDDPIDQLEFEVRSTYSQLNAEVESGNANINITADKNFYGNSIDVKLIVRDTSGAVDSISFLLYINPVNDPPEEFKRLFPVDYQSELVENCEFKWENAADPENDPVSYILTIHCNDLDPSIILTDTSFTYNFSDVQIDTVQDVYWDVIAFDSKDMTHASQDGGYFKLISDSKYEVHTKFYQIKPIQDIVIDEDKGEALFAWMLNETFINNTSGVISYVYQISSDLFLGYKFQADTCTFYTKPNAYGTASLIVKAQMLSGELSGTILRDTLQIIVLPINDPPKISLDRIFISSTVEDNMVVGKISASDIEDDSLNFELLSTEQNGLFSLDAYSGELHLNKRTDLIEFGTIDFHALVRVFDVNDFFSSDTSEIIIDFSHVFKETFIDERDGQEYPYVKIGNQTWMAENLRASQWEDDRNLENVYRWYKNDSAKFAIPYGAFYSWDALMCMEAARDSTQGIIQGACPDGWHVPSVTEWEELFSAVNRPHFEAARLKSTYGWKNDYNRSDPYGFSGVPTFEAVPGNSVRYWTSTETDSSNANSRMFFYGEDYIYRYVNSKDQQLSVRCVKDNGEFDHSYDFGYVDKFSTDTSRTIQIINRDEPNLLIDSIKGFDLPFSYNCSLDSLQLYDTLFLNISVNPNFERGNYLDTLLIYSSGSVISVFAKAMTNTIDTTYLNELICYSESVSIGDSVITETGNYRLTLKNIFGCDSTVFLNLQVFEEDITNISTV
ncbi:MAG: FISUMP domain-containing protein, partial [Bacteroidales bacterium]|nr:FISUMP domain-containing protein [Bacteroidales bacterium]